MLQYLKDPKILIPVIVLVLAILIFFYPKSTDAKTVAVVAKAAALQEGANNIVLSDNQGNLSQIAFPKGIVVIWTGSADKIPDGWALCDGQGGTPDLRTKFLLGINKDSNNPSYRTIGGTGGSETHTLTEAEMPRHSHGTIPDLTTCHFVKKGGLIIESDGCFYHEEKGGNQPHNNMPPYYTVAYIVKL